MRILLLSVALMSATVVSAEQSLVLDFSMSMAGFATSPDNRIPGVLQRLAVLLEASSPLRAYGLSGAGQGILTSYPWKQAATLYATPKSFRGSTPLSRAIDEAVARRKATDLIVMTDGMEDSGNLDRLAATVTDLVGRKWAAGLVAVALPFNGTYYTEQTITDAMLPEIQRAVRTKNAAWNVQKESRTVCKPGECYGFRGERALLFLCFSSSGSAARLIDLVHQALLESKVQVLGTLYLAPFRPPALSVVVEAPPTTRARIKLPSAAAQDLTCAEPVSERMQMSLRAVSTSPVSQPSALRASDLQILEKPNWIVQPPRPDAKTPGLYNFEVICPKGSFTQPVSLAPGALRVRYSPTLDVAGPGWWDEWSAENSWQSPFKVYKLTSFIRAVHGKALSGYTPTPVDYTLRLKVQN